MIGIAKESLAPIHFESLRQKHRTSAEGLVPEIVFCLFLCKGIRKDVGIEEIAAQASLTYPSDFYTLADTEAASGSCVWKVGHHLNGHRQVFPLDLLLHPIFQGYSASDEVYLRNRIIWHYEHGLHCKHRFSGRHETILRYTKGKEYMFNLDDVRVPQKYPGKRGYRGANRGKYTGNPLGKNPGDVWIFPNVKAIISKRRNTLVSFRSNCLTD
jgi:hypothetical protein